MPRAGEVETCLFVWAFAEHEQWDLSVGKPLKSRLYVFEMELFCFFFNFSVWILVLIFFCALMKKCLRYSLDPPESIYGFTFSSWKQTLNLLKYLLKGGVWTASNSSSAVPQCYFTHFLLLLDSCSLWFIFCLTPGRTEQSSYKNKWKHHTGTVKPWRGCPLQPAVTVLIWSWCAKEWMQNEYFVIFTHHSTPSCCGWIWSSGWWFIHCWRVGYGWTWAWDWNFGEKLKKPSNDHGAYYRVGKKREHLIHVEPLLNSLHLIPMSNKHQQLQNIPIDASLKIQIFLECGKNTLLTWTPIQCLFEVCCSSHKNAAIWSTVKKPQLCLIDLSINCLINLTRIGVSCIQFQC